MNKYKSVVPLVNSIRGKSTQRMQHLKNLLESKTGQAELQQRAHHSDKHLEV
jgi:hypothetical protein